MNQSIKEPCQSRVLIAAHLLLFFLSEGDTSQEACERAVWFSGALLRELKEAEERESSPAVHEPESIEASQVGGR